MRQHHVSAYLIYKTRTLYVQYKLLASTEKHYSEMKIVKGLK